MICALDPLDHVTLSENNSDNSKHFDRRPTASKPTPEDESCFLQNLEIIIPFSNDDMPS